MGQPTQGPSPFVLSFIVGDGFPDFPADLIHQLRRGNHPHQASKLEKRVYFRDSELTRAYGWMRDAVPLAEEDQVKIPAFAEEMGLAYTQAGMIEIEPAEESRVVHTDAKRWVLTDEYVYSAADGFAGFCKQTGWATLVGRRTRGDGGASAPVLVRLPESGLLMRFTLAASANVDGTLNTLFGTSPDFPSKPFEHPFQTLQRIIDRQAGR